MFRTLSRKKQELTREECVELLKNEKRGVLSVSGDDGYPYGVPIDHYYDERDGKIYFHSGKSGHKIDALARCDKVSYLVLTQGVKREGSWSLDYRSVIVFGRARVVREREKVYEISRLLSRKFTSDEAYIENEISRVGAGTVLIELTVEHLCGKKVNES